MIGTDGCNFWCVFLLSQSRWSHPAWIFFITEEEYVDACQPELNPSCTHTQKVSKDFHSKLDSKTRDLPWGAVTAAQKQAIRQRLKSLCIQEKLFPGYDAKLEPALEWRLYQLQRNAAQKSRGGSVGQSNVFLCAAFSSAFWWHTSSDGV